MVESRDGRADDDDGDSDVCTILRVPSESLPPIVGIGRGQCPGMASPSWRVKTRPCPFYQQGRCFFADSCNFQHSASAKISSGPHTPISDSSQSLGPPIANVTSTPILSPHRSPRLAGLLLALKDVIGEDPDDEIQANIINAASEESTIANSISLCREHHVSIIDLDGASFEVTGDIRDSRLPLSYEPLPGSQPSAQAVVDITRLDRSLSPVNLSHLVNFNQNHHDTEVLEPSSSIDSGYADTRKPPTMAPLCSPPRSPLKSTFGLLSSPFRTPSMRMLSPQLSAFIERQPLPETTDFTSEPSLDSPEKVQSGEDDVVEGSEEYVVVEDDDSTFLPYATIHEDSATEHGPSDHPAPVFSWEDENQSDGMRQVESSLLHQGATEDSNDREELQLRRKEVSTGPDTQNPPTSGEYVDQAHLAGPSTCLGLHQRSNGISSRDEENSTVIYLGIPPPTQTEVQLALNQTTTASDDFLADMVQFVDDECVGNSSIADCSYDDSLLTGSFVLQETIHDRRQETENEHVAPPDDASFSEYYESPDSLEDNRLIVDPNGSPQVLEREVVDVSTPDDTYDYSYEANSLTSPGTLSRLMGQNAAEDTAQFETSSFFDSYNGSVEQETSAYDLDDATSESAQEGDEDPTTRLGYYSSVDTYRAVEMQFTAGAVDNGSLDCLELPFNLQAVESPHPLSSHDSHTPSRHTLVAQFLDDSGDGTVELAYLYESQENDTLTSIYADYSEVSGGSTESTESVKTVPDEAPGEDTNGKRLSAILAFNQGLIRERVFTPPPGNGRTRSGTIVPSVYSPASASAPSPPVSLDGSQAPISACSATQSVWSPDSSVASDAAGGIESKRVPFGFRQSLVVGRVGRSSSGSRTTQKSSKLLRRVPPPLYNDHAHSPDAISPTTESISRGLRPLRLSALIHPRSASVLSRPPSCSVNSYRHSSLSSAPVSSRNSLSFNSLLSSRRTSIIPENNENTLDNPSPLSSVHLSHLANFNEPHSAPLARPAIWQTHIGDDEDGVTSTAHEYIRPVSRFSEPSYVYGEEDENIEESTQEYTIRRALRTVVHSAPVSHTSSIVRPPLYAIATPKPTLMFAIASDDIKQVRQVLECGDASPNDPVGPQSALEFALTNNQLVNKVEIVKSLLAFGADPKVITTARVREADSPESSEAQAKTPSSPLLNPLLAALDPATKYYVKRADAPHTGRTSALIHRSFFRPLTRIRYELVGQDHALEELFKTLSAHSRQLAVAPIVILLCGPSGHGKSFLARKFGTLLDVPTHTVNMTILHSAQDLWKSCSMGPYETPTTCTLAEFLINNEGKRCVVVLDEIEKTRDEKTLWALLMPWEIGRCTFEANGRPVDVRNVVWLGTSNVGHELVLQHHETQPHPDELMAKEEYADLIALLRSRVSQRLGASILSRVTIVLPFVPFTLDERRAICCEALYNIAGDIVRTLRSEVIDKIIDEALAGYIAEEGARSLYRAVSSQIVNNI